MPPLRTGFTQYHLLVSCFFDPPFRREREEQRRAAAAAEEEMKRKEADRGWTDTVTVKVCDAVTMFLACMLLCPASLPL